MKKKRKQKKEDNYRVLAKWTAGIALIAFGLIFGLAAFGLGGLAGSAIFGFGFGVIGVAAFLLPALLVAIGLAIMLERTFVSPLTATGIVLILISTLTFLGIVSQALGGQAGALLGHTAAEFFGVWGALIILLAVACIGLIIATDVIAVMNAAKEAFSKAGGSLGSVRLPSLPSRKGESDAPEEDENETEPDAAPDAVEEQKHSTEPTVTVFSDKRPGDGEGDVVLQNFDAEYQAPTLALLGEDKGKPGVGDIKANANIIKRTFQNFGISVEMDEVSVGPTVTRYAIKPAEGVRLNKIISLQNNLELALAAHPVRIEAPIPGKSLVGIEVPNATKAMVGLGGVIGAPEWGTSKKPLLAAVGRDIAGTPHYVNVAKMPHGLIAGATGSGKSVAIHAVITSLLYRNGPNQMRFIMVDPKRVELTLYNGIPHLLTPVITDPKKCIFALKWAAKEMDRRYGILEDHQVRDIDSYHQTILEPARKRKAKELPEAMPYIVIVVDELADIMQTYPRELESAIVRLAQMSRAVGIHLILSTQRPSVNVITGLIKANVPTRLALQVSSQIDSRTILDASGAELLLGAGDMLYQSADMQKPVRLQTAYISEQEVKKVVAYIKQHNAGSLSSLDLGAGTNGTGVHEPNDAIMLAGDDEEVDDDLYTAAREAVEEAGRASTSYLQRKLRIGYSRAARLMDILEEKGVIGPADGSRPREIIGGGSAPSDTGESEEDDRGPY
ncbi:MAG: DNA segregation ATPase FtsK/SpoIIIE, S-DNA-T family [Parcubacteria bacterium C7867-004]|nr:MAG: DNA segregation ATPase FtsK/SpoIIIE, S-DNA-T family [Parcubacteria bacterium C7867-004]